jgi:hypothetical protein
MATIDKTYIDGKEYSLYRQWWIDNYNKMVKELEAPIWLYTFDVFYNIDLEFEIDPNFLSFHTKDIEEYKNRYDFPIWNTSEKQDKWLLKNCNIQSFRNRMLQVYPENWKGFKGCKWIAKNNKPKYVR